MFFHFYFFICFYLAILCYCGICYGPVSVFVTSWHSTKTAKHRITQTTPHHSPVILVFWCQRSQQNSTGVNPYGGVKWRWGGSHSTTFGKYHIYIYIYWNIRSLYHKKSKMASRPAVSVGVYIAWPQQMSIGFVRCRSMLSVRSLAVKCLIIYL